MQTSMWARIPSLSTTQLFIIFAVTAWLIYTPALEGQFVSDDIYYVQTNRCIHELTARNRAGGWGSPTLAELS